MTLLMMIFAWILIVFDALFTVFVLADIIHRNKTGESNASNYFALYVYTFQTLFPILYVIGVGR